MTTKRYTHKLKGCAPIPLASYLKALGILRLVAEQADPQAQGWWSGEVFHLRTVLSRDDLSTFFLEEYQPTPIVAPWNGGSGFYPKDNRTALAAIEGGGAGRVARYRETISACRSMLLDLRLKEKPDGESKKQLLVACRGRLFDEAVAWLDAAFVLTEAGTVVN